MELPLERVGVLLEVGEERVKELLASSSTKQVRMELYFEDMTTRRWIGLEDRQMLHTARMAGLRCRVPSMSSRKRVSTPSCSARWMLSSFKSTRMESVAQMSGRRSLSYESIDAHEIT